MATLPPLAVSLIITAVATGAQVGLTYLMREKGNQSPIDQGKQDDLRITGSEYGSIIPRVWGRTRMGSNIIWSSGIRHTVIDYPSQGGKGTPAGPSTRTHVYDADFGVQICRGPIYKIERIWADSDVLGEQPNYIATFEAESATKPSLTAPATNVAENYNDTTASIGQAVRKMGKQATNQYGVIEFDVANSPTQLKFDPAKAADALSRVDIYYKTPSTSSVTMRVFIDYDNAAPYVDSDVTFSGTNGVWEVISFTAIQTKVGDIDGQHFSLVRLGATTDTAAGPDIDRIVVTKIWKEDAEDKIPLPAVTGFIDPLIDYPDNLDPAAYFNFVPQRDNTGLTTVSPLNADTIKIYEGTTNQVKDAKLIDYLDTRFGTGNGTTYAPAHRETAMAVFNAYNLRSGRIPNLTFEVVTNEADMSYVLEDLFTDCGLAATDYDLTGADAYDFVGIVDNQKQSRKAFIESLGNYFGFRLAEINGKIRVVDNNTFASAGTISADILRARGEGDEPAAFDAEVLVSPTNELPQMLRFNVMNPDLDYHNETVQAFVHADLYSADTQDFNFPVVDRPEDARKRAEYFLLKAYAESKSITFDAMPEMLKYSIGDVVTVPINGVNQKIRIEKMTGGLPIGVIKVEGFLIEEYEAGDIATAVVASELSSAKQAQLLAVSFPRNSKAIPILSLPIRQSEKVRLGCYIALTPTGIGASQNIALYMEQAADNYIIKDICDVPSTCGVTDGTLGSHGNVNTVDTTNTLDILFYNDVSLETVTAGDITRYPELNLIRVGAEWLQFRTAVKQSLASDSPYRSKWRISNLTRGRFETSAAMSGHGASEDAVLFTNNLRWYDFRPEDVGETVKVKTTTGGQALEDVKTTSFTFNPPSRYTVTNDLVDRTYDANSTSINELSDVIATIIDDLKL